MARTPLEDADLQLVEEIIFAPHGLISPAIQPRGNRCWSNPDFRVLKEKVVVAYCKVKSPRDDWLDNQLDHAAPMEIVGGARNDTVFNRIARHVEKAVTQFDAVNSARTLPNILVFINHDKASNCNDLRETLTGFFCAENGEHEATMMHISEGRIGQSKQRIDLYIWVDVRTRRVQGYVFSESIPEHVTRACELLGMDASRIKR